MEKEKEKNACTNNCSFPQVLCPAVLVKVGFVGVAQSRGLTKPPLGRYYFVFAFSHGC